MNHNRSVEIAYALVNVAKASGADAVKFQLESPTEYCLTFEETRQIYKYCRDIGMPFACTAFDVKSLNFLLEETQMAFIKIASCDSDNIALLNTAEVTNLRIIQSVREGSLCYAPPGFRKREILHVVSEYPTPLAHANLMRVANRGIDGLSDHSGNPLIPAIAVALGAKIIECHLTLDKEMPGPDHKASLNPLEFGQMIRNVCDTELALGGA